ncbi:MAG: S4 domain-containing protein, partial [Candidatus Acidiferrales bacterium]
MLERLQKIIARAGLASRRHAEALITSGLVTVNGRTITELGTKADASRDHIKVSGRLIQPESAAPDRQRIYLALHKPAEVVSTLSDPEGRRSLRELLHGVSERVFPIGRLEYHASGLILLTNDGDLANRLLQSHRLPQTWHIKLASLLTFEETEKLAAATGARIARLPGQNNPWYEITLAESSSDSLRTKLFHADHPVDKMKRIAIASVSLDRLPPGAYRPLAPGEISALSRAAAGDAPPKPVAPVAGSAPLRPQFTREAPQKRPSPRKSAHGQHDHANFSRSREFEPEDRAPEKPERPAWSRPPGERPPKPEYGNSERGSLSGMQNASSPGSRPWKSGPGKPAYGKSSRPPGSAPWKSREGSAPRGDSPRPAGQRPWKSGPGKPAYGKSSRPPGSAPWKSRE